MKRHGRNRSISELFEAKARVAETMIEGLRNPFHDAAHARKRRKTVMELLSRLLPHETLDDWKYPALETASLMIDFGRIGSDSEKTDTNGPDIVRERAVALLLDPKNGGRASSDRIRFVTSQISVALRYWEECSHGRLDHIPVASSKTQKILVLADLPSFAEGHDLFLEESLLLLEEYPWEPMFRIDAFLGGQRIVLDTLLRRMLDGLAETRSTGSITASFRIVFQKP